MKKLTPDSVKETLNNSIDFIFSNKEKYLSNPNTSFSRVQKISFRNTMIFPMIMDNDSTPIEMLEFFDISNLPSASAMNYRRSQVYTHAFKDLLTNFTNKLPQKKTFYGKFLVAGDGTRINTPYNPKDSNSYVNSIPGRRGFNQYHLNTLYDVLNDLFIDADIQDYFHMNENVAFCEMLDRYPEHKQTIFILDRGYSSYNLLSHLIKKNKLFVIRCTSTMAENIFDNISELLSADEVDVVDVVRIGRMRTKAAKALPNYHYFSNSKTYDSIPAGSKSIDELKIRLIKLILPGGGGEYLLTNLDNQEFSISDLKEIYRLRWGIETSYRYLKYTSGMTHIHSIKPQFIFQEIYAKLISYNFCAAIANIITVESRCKKHTYVTDKTYLFKVCIRFLKNKIDDIYSLCIKKKVPRRADRKFERNIRRQHADTLQYR